MSSQTRRCKQGMFYRKAYTRKSKLGKIVRVPGRCIRSQTTYNTPYSPHRTTMRGYRMTARSLRTCPPGYIKRAAFVRRTKSGKRSHVPEQCIPDVGLPGKGYAGPGPGIGPLRKGELSKYGYTNIASLNIVSRRAALEKAIDEFGSLGVWRKLNAVAVYTRRTSPSVSQIIQSDMDWVRRKYGLRAFN